MYWLQTKYVLFTINSEQFFICKSQNPIHSQDLLLRVDASGNLVVNFNELNSLQQMQDDPTNKQDHVTNDISEGFNLQVWLQRCNMINCCIIQCIHLVLP
eukprot:NODE_105_length_19900_cov_0.306550.p11 type:complete len:100 gc:universal NODE_105_length_19900_cov_0.306550:3013-3312(+)